MSTHENSEQDRPLAVPLQRPVRLNDVGAAFKDWVRDIPFHERTPWNVWHAAVEWVRSNG